jgi:hypothetical protein
VIKSLRPDPTTFDLTHAHLTAGDIDGLDLMEGARVDVLLLAEGLRRAGDEGVNVVDNLADVVG